MQEGDAIALEHRPDLLDETLDEGGPGAGLERVNAQLDQAVHRPAGRTGIAASWPTTVVHSRTCHLTTNPPKT